MPRTVPGPYGRNKKVENILLLLRNSTPSEEKRQRVDKTLHLDEYKNNDEEKPHVPLNENS